MDRKIPAVHNHKGVDCTDTYSRIWDTVYPLHTMGFKSFHCFIGRCDKWKIPDGP